MHYVSLCRKAKEDMETLIKLMHEHEENGVEIPMEMKIDFLVNDRLCEKALMEDTWVGFHEKVYDATYPDSYDEIRHSGKEKHAERKHELTIPEMEKWVSHMKNQDGTHGAHWDMTQTTEVGKKNSVNFNEISKECLWLGLNKMYSDHYNTARKYGLQDSPEFYLSLLIDIIDDADSVSFAERMYVTYHDIAKM